MTRDLQIYETNADIYSIKTSQTESVESDKLRLKDTEAKTIKENRFKRYKRSLRKRPRSIL